MTRVLRAQWVHFQRAGTEGKDMWRVFIGSEANLLKVIFTSPLDIVGFSEIYGVSLKKENIK